MSVIGHKKKYLIKEDERSEKTRKYGGRQQHGDALALEQCAALASIIVYFSTAKEL